MCKHRLGVLAVAVLFAVLPNGAWAAGTGAAVIGTASDGNLAVVFLSPNTGLPTPTESSVTGIPSGALPHGVGNFGVDRALISDFFSSRIFIVQLSNSSLVSTISTAPAYNGSGSVASSPLLDAIIGAGRDSSGASSAAVIKSPLTNPTVVPLALPGSAFVAAYQTQAVVFSAQGRAFVYHTQGISVLDPPYTSVAFTIPLTNPASGALAITPDGNALMATDASTLKLSIFKAPFSANSTPATLTLPGSGLGLDGIAVTPDGSKALVGTIPVTSTPGSRVFAVSAPFSSSSVVEEIPLPAPFSTGDPGFEDVGLSPDGQLAILTGNSINNHAPALFLRAPFTASGATAFAVNVLGNGRGAGAVRFVGTVADLSIGKVGPASVVRSASIAYTLTITNNGPADAVGVTVSDSTPPGLTFVSTSGACTTAFPCFLGNLSAGASRTITATFTVAANYSGPDPIVNTATVSSNTTDTTSTNNTAAASTAVTCTVPAAPAAVAIAPSANPTGPVTATDFLKLGWSVPLTGPPPSRYEYRINGDAYQTVTPTGAQVFVDNVAPRGRLDPITLFARAFACKPELGPGPEASSPVYSLAPPGASFSVSKTAPRVGEEVIFTESSSPQATSWLWFFGNSGFSSVQNPKFTFTTPGMYGVALVATNGSGSSVSTTLFLNVTNVGTLPARSRTRSTIDRTLGDGEWERSGVSVAPPAHVWLTLTGEEDAVVFVRLLSKGELLVERRLAVLAGDSTRVDLNAYLPAGFSGTTDLRVVSDRPIVTTVTTVTTVSTLTEDEP